MSNTILEDPPYIYYDMTVSNFNSVNNPDNTLNFSFIDRQNSNVINNCKKYYLAITRFTVDSASIPVFECPILPNQPDVNKSLYSITLDYYDTTTSPPSVIAYSQEFMIWKPADLNSTPPTSNPVGQFYNISSGNYYLSYDYHWVLSLLNNTFQTAMTNLITQVPSLAGIDAPFMSWNNDTSTATIWARQDTFDVTQPKYVRIWFNRILYNAYSSFPIIKNNQSSFAAFNYFEFYQIQMNPFNGINVQSAPNSPFGLHSAIFCSQEYSTTTSFSPINSFIFCTSTMPILGNRFSAPSFIFNGQLQQYNEIESGFLSNTVSNFSLNVISSFQTDQNSYRSNLLYSPQQYKYITMSGDNALTQIDIQCYYIDKGGIIHNFYLNDGSNASMQIMFKRRDLPY